MDSQEEKLFSPGLKAALVFVVLSGLLAAWVFSSGQEVDRSPDPALLAQLEELVDGAPCQLSQEKESGLSEHKESVDYSTALPTSGPHHPTPADAEKYSEPPEMSQVVHSLEHGDIAIQYQEIDADQLSQLEAVYDESPEQTLLFENSAMDTPLAVTAWGHLLTCSELTPESLEAVGAFRDTYRDHGPENL